MLTIILATLLNLQTTPQDLYKLNYEQDGSGVGTVRLTIEPQNGFKWGGCPGSSYNAVLRLQSNRNVILPKRRFTSRNGDFSQEGKNGFVDIPFRLKIFEEQTIEGTIDFLICKENICQPARAKIQFKISGEPGC